MDIDLIGYCLGALEPDEMQEIERRLAADPELRRELGRVQASLGPLAGDEPPIEPPAGLSERVLDRLETAAVTGQPIEPKLGLSPAEPATTSRGYRAVDVIGLCAAAICFFAVLFPALWDAKVDASAEVCQENLRLLGQSVSAFAQQSPDRRIPRLSLSGPEAFAGIYAVRLNEEGLLDESQWLWCPSTAAGEAVEVPRLAVLREAPEAELRNYQRLAGGNYAYSLGVIEGDNYTAPRLTGRTNFAILGDAVVLDSGDGPAHGSRGINVLFEDGHVERVSHYALLRGADHLFLNYQGRSEAGLNPSDSTLAPSAQPPFVWVRGQ